MAHEKCSAAVVGEVTRVLLLSALLFGPRARLPLRELGEMVDLAEPRLRRLLYLFYRQRWIWYDCGRSTVGLTDTGFAALARTSPLNPHD
jgi:hypothetical protein